MGGLVAEVLHTQACASWQAAVARVRVVAGREGLSVDIAETTVETPAQAVERRFIGSPSVRVDGWDVEPGAELREDFGLG